MNIQELQKILTSHPATTSPQQIRTAKSNNTAAADASTTSGSSGSSITSDDFLQLLVAEMKNQDPTADTDPNQYINQLVQVNSLQQLIQINATLSGDTATSTSSQAVSSSTSAASGSAAIANALTRESNPRRGIDAALHVTQTQSS
jgi:flagellar basal-body rod modification protein FlgD